MKHSHFKIQRESLLEIKMMMRKTEVRESSHMIVSMRIAYSLLMHFAYPCSAAVVTPCSVKKKNEQRN